MEPTQNTESQAPILTIIDDVFIPALADRLSIANHIPLPEEFNKFLSTENGKMYEGKIKGYMDIQTKIENLWLTMRKLFVVICQNPDSGYGEQYWKNSDVVETHYAKLKGISNTKSLNAILCPAIHCAEIYYGKV